MQLSGIISAIQPAGGYASQHGYIYTFNMTIQDQQGQQYTGQIGSKSEQYPMQVGAPIVIESTTNQNGTSFKKIQQQQQGQRQNLPQGQPPAQQQGPSPYDKETEGKCICQVVTAGISSGQLKCEPHHIRYWVELIMGKQAYPVPEGTPGNVSQQAIPDPDPIPYNGPTDPPQQQAQAAGPNIPEDEIPF